MAASHMAASHLAESHMATSHMAHANGTWSTEPLMEIEEGEFAKASSPILFLFVSFILGALVRFLLKRLSIPLPYTVVVFVFGATMGLVSHHYESLQVYTYLARIDPKLLLHMFLPILIFESAFAMDAHTFVRCFSQCILMAVPGLLICSGLTAFLSVNLFVSYQWTWHSALLFGSILSATDPVAVVALLRDVGTSKILTTIIDGEALLNDGSAIVIYEVLMELAMPGKSMTGKSLAWMFCRIAFGGPLLGFVMGKVAVWSLSKVFNDSVIEITITLSSAYVTYYLAENVCYVSGVLAVVALGVVISANKVSISPEVEEFVHSFWEMLSYLANTLIFIIVGVVITERSLSFIEKNDLFLILITYIGITVFRCIRGPISTRTITDIFNPGKWGEKGTVKHESPNTARNTAPNLQSPNTAPNTSPNTNTDLCLEIRVVLSLSLPTLQGQRCMNALSPWKKSNMANAVRHLREVQKRALQVHQEDVFLTDADWKYVDNYTSIVNPYDPKDGDRPEQPEENGDLANGALPAYMFRKLSHMSLCPDCSEHHLCQPSQQEKDEMLNEARIRMISAQKVHYWRQFESGLLLRESASVLTSAADAVADKAGTFITVGELRKNWEINRVYKWLQDHFVEPVTERNNYNKSRWQKKMPEERWRKPFYAATHHTGFNFALSLILVTDVACTLAELVLRLGDCGRCYATTVLRWTNLGFVTFYFFELIFKLVGRGLRAHFHSYWNVLDFVVLWVSIASAAIEIEMELSDSWYSEYIVLLRLCRLFRLLHFKRLVRLFLPVGTKVADVVNHRVNEQLTAGYDIGRGFMISQYEVGKFLDQMVDYQPIAERLKKICGDSRLEIVRELAALQDKYPKVAVAVKTRRAVRHVLNSTRDELIELKEAGMLDDGVFHSLLEEIEEKMMRLHSAPTSIVPAPPTELLKNVNWIKGNEELFNYFQEKVILQSYPSGWSLGKEGEEPNGIYVIVCGVVKVEGTVTEKDGGSLPNTDSYHWFMSQGHLQDLLTVGAVLGELGVLTKKPRQTRATCETDVRAFHVPQSVMLEAMQRFSRHPSLEYRLWRSCALKVARSVLSVEPKYENWSQNKLMMHLDHAFLPDLSTVNSYLVRPSMTDVILVQGVATDVNNADEFLGPVYIPSTVYSITLRKNVYNDRTILVIVGDETFMPDANLDWSGTSQRRGSIMNNFGLCLLHDVRRRQSVLLDADDNPRGRSWSDNFRKRFLSNADSTLQLAPGKRRLSMFNTGEKSGIDNPTFVTEKIDFQHETKPRSWTDKFRVRFGPTETMAPGCGGGTAPDRTNRRMSMFSRMERIDSYGNVTELQDNGNGESKPAEQQNGNMGDDSAKKQGQLPEIVFSHF
ncbi:unnamed protein product [Ixodes hexagonus]